MQNYLNLLGKVLREGVRTANRTGIDTLMLPGEMLRFDLRNGFPAITTKKLAFDACKGEVIGFLRGYTNAEDFAKLGCKWWFSNANENKDWLANPNRRGENDLGRIYGAQWRDWPGSVEELVDATTENPSPYRTPDGKGLYQSRIDQVQLALRTIRENPTSRRIIISGWNPAELSHMALPPCHVLYQFIADPQRQLLHLCMYQRSCDLFLGVPMNIAGSALMLELFARLTGYTAATFTHFLADAHIYVNHREQVAEQMKRRPFALPKLHISDEIAYDSAIDSVLPEDFWLEGYQSHEAIKADMAV